MRHGQSSEACSAFLSSAFYDMAAFDAQDIVLGRADAWHVGGKVKRINNSNSFKFVDLFYENLKPDIILSGLLGIFPLIRERDGSFKMKIISFRLVHSLVTYAIMSYMGYLVFNHLMAEIQATKEGRLYIYAIFLFLNLLPGIMVCESFKICRYFNFWNRYQARYISITGSSIDINLHQVRIVSFIIKLCGAVLFLGMVIRRFSSNHLVLSIFFSYYYCVITSLSSIWYISIFYLYKILNMVQNNIKKIANNESNLTIADMEILWLDLSRLTKSLGYNFCFTLSYFLLFLFMEVIVTTYEALIISLSMTIDPVLTPMTILVLLYMASIPFTAELATKKIGDNFFKFVLDLKIKENAGRHLEEIDTLLQTVLDNPPAFDLGGFVILDNGVITSLMSTMVTYLIVLLQFKV